MSDPGHVVIRTSTDPDVILFTQDLGSVLPGILSRALARRQRSEQSSDLARVVFGEMVRGCETAEIGFGISAGDIRYSEHAVLVADTAIQRVGAVAVPEGTTQHTGEVLDTWSFEEFAALGPASCWVLNETTGEWRLQPRQRRSRQPRVEPRPSRHHRQPADAWEF